MNQSLLRFIIKLVIFIIKTGQVKNCLRALIWVIKTKRGYDEAMARLDGSYYDKQVKDATEDYKRKHPEDFECRVNVPGFDRWKIENDGATDPGQR